MPSTFRILLGKKNIMSRVVWKRLLVWGRATDVVRIFFIIIIFSLSLSLSFSSKSHGSQNSGNGVPTPPHAAPVPPRPKPISALTSGAWNRRYCSVQTYIIWPDLVNSFYATDSATATTAAAVRWSPKFGRNFLTCKNKISEPCNIVGYYVHRSLSSDGWVRGFGARV